MCPRLSTMLVGLAGLLFSLVPVSWCPFPGTHEFTWHPQGMPLHVVVIGLAWPVGRASPPGPLSIFDGEGEEMLAHGSWGAFCQIWCNCGAFAPYFFIFPFSSWLVCFGEGVTPFSYLFFLLHL